LVSILKSVSELEEYARLQQQTKSSYAMAIRSAAEYVVELDAAQAKEFRQHLGTLQQAAETALQVEDFRAIESSFRGELRDYRDRSQDWLARMRSEMQGTAQALQSLADGLSSNGTGYEQQLNADLQALRGAADSHNLAQIRATIKSAVASIALSLDQMQRANRLTAAQLHDEIRLLHREMDNERKALFTDPVSGAWNHEKMAGRIEELLDRGEAFCVVIAWLNNFKRAKGKASQPVVEGALKALVKRAHGILGRDAMLGRWAEDEFIVIVEAVAARAIAMSTELSQQLSLRYVVQQDGVSHHLPLRVTTTVVDRSPGSDPDQFRERLKHGSVALRGV
jgi:GGDEF domain-containing protein